MVFQNDILAGSSGASGTSTTVHTIGQSIRFNDDDNAVLSRTISSTSSTTTNTISMWVKRGNLGNSRSGSGSDALGQTLFQSGRNASNFFEVNFGGTTAGAIGTSENALRISSITGDSIIMKLNTTAIFRDTSAWYNIVAVVDTTNDVASERLRLYVNGNRQTDFTSTTFPSKDTETELFRNTSNVLSVGAWVNPSESVRYFDGYMAEITVINGQALDPSSFGLYNDSNIWIPKDVSGLSFGANGFHIDGRDSADLGDDESGNGNDFTTSGLASNDQVADSPTNNFATINSVYADNASAGNAGTLSNGNLQYVGGGSTFSVKGLTFNLPKSGKWYFEYMIGGNLDGFGFVKQGEQGTINASNGPGQLSVAQGGGIQNTGWRNGGSNTTTFADSNTGSPFTAGFIHQVAIDVDNGKFYYGVKNTYYAADGGNDGNPSAGTNHMSTFAFSTTDVVLLAGNYSGTQYWNFGQDGTFSGQQTAQGNSDANGVGNFYYAPPTNYLALCTKNLGS